MITTVRAGAREWLKKMNVSMDLSESHISCAGDAEACVQDYSVQFICYMKKIFILNVKNKHSLSPPPYFFGICFDPPPQPIFLDYSLTSYFPFYKQPHIFNPCYSSRH
jgi:hypothetical protein